jgi:hypothetical protein
MSRDVFPVTQGFPRPPDGGTVDPSPLVETAAPSSQGFPPAPLAQPFPAEPTPPSTPTNPALQAFSPAPSVSTYVPPALDVDVAAMAPDESGAPTYVVSEVGNLPTVAQDSVATFVLAAVTDFATGLAPGPTTVDLLLTLDPSSKPLNSFGAQLFGRTLYFASGAWVPTGTTPQRPVLTYGPLALVVANADADGVLLTSLGGGPVAGNQVALDVSVSEGEVVTNLLGIVQDVVPQTLPLLDEESGEGGTLGTLLPVQEVDVGDQATSVGTPADYFPTSLTTITSEGPTQDVDVAQQTGVIGIPVDHYQSNHNP